MPAKSRTRCEWAGSDPLYLAYHDEEWGVPLHDDQRLFEFLILEGAQAGLSWIMILKKRENYQKAFAGFDPEKIARFTPKRVPWETCTQRTVQGVLVNSTRDQRVAACTDLLH